jgi:nitrite reductase/ring-hydroxylating ferredoxin subunit
MSLRTRTSSVPQVSRPRVPSRIPIARIPQPRENRMAATWQLAKPARIARALRTAQSRNSGGWFVAGASGDVGRTQSVTRTIAGREVVFWRSSVGALVAGPGACPHLGALLDKCPVVDGTMYCRWHGFALTQGGDQTWSPYRAYDDGVLIWVGLPTDGEVATDLPALAARPPLLESVSAVIAKPGICEPQDVIANRLDPWHGSWFHPYAFSHLVVDDDASSDQALVVDVTFRLSRTWGVPVRAEFTSPDSRTIVMHITEGEGRGSVVETHATPLGLGPDDRPRTMVTEATIAYSDRTGFQVARWLSPLVRPGIRHTARKLWVDDLAYAERRYELRQRGEFPG